MWCGILTSFLWTAATVSTCCHQLYHCPWSAVTHNEGQISFLLRTNPCKVHSAECVMMTDVGLSSSYGPDPTSFPSVGQEIHLFISLFVCPIEQPWFSSSYESRCNVILSWLGLSWRLCFELWMCQGVTKAWWKEHASIFSAPEMSAVCLDSLQARLAKKQRFFLLTFTHLITVSNTIETRWIKLQYVMWEVMLVVMNLQRQIMLVFMQRDSYSGALTFMSPLQFSIQSCFFFWRGLQETAKFPLRDIVRYLMLFQLVVSPGQYAHTDQTSGNNWTKRKCTC